DASGIAALIVSVSDDRRTRGRNRRARGGRKDMPELIALGVIVGERRAARVRNALPVAIIVVGVADGAMGVIVVEGRRPAPPFILRLRAVVVVVSLVNSSLARGRAGDSGSDFLDLRSIVIVRLLPRRYAVAPLESLQAVAAVVD